MMINATSETGIKNLVIGIVDKEKNKVYAKVSLFNKDEKNLSGNQLLAILNEICKKKSYYHH